MRADAASLHPDAVVVEFSGNALTPCMKILDGTAVSGAAYFEKHAADAAAVLDIFTPGHALVFFAGAPISRRAERTGDPTTPTLHAIYAALARSTPYGRYSDAGASVLSGGRWVETLPCLAGEPCTGGRDANGTPVNVVRALDGAHFCPGAPAAVRGVTGACSVWPSGAWGSAWPRPSSPSSGHTNNEDGMGAGRPTLVDGPAPVYSWSGPRAHRHRHEAGQNRGPAHRWAVANGLRTVQCTLGPDRSTSRPRRKEMEIGIALLAITLAGRAHRRQAEGYGSPGRGIRGPGGHPPAGEASRHV
jgi:hypothetical protein